MKLILLTGGVATGKSSFGRELLKRLPQAVPMFDCDLETRDLLTTPEVQSKIRGIFGEKSITESKEVNKPFLRQTIVKDPDAKRQLESVIHPEIRARFHARLASESSTARFFLADVPLLYEGGFPTEADLAVVVACSPTVQLQRLMLRNELDEPSARRWMALQMPVLNKIPLADRVIWNDGPLSLLERQAATTAQLIDELP